MMDHSLPYLVNCSLLFTEEPQLRRPGAARAAGFSAVEFWWPFATPVPSDREVDAFVSAVSEAGVVNMPLPKPFITGTDVAGTVDAVGPGAKRFQVGARHRPLHHAEIARGLSIDRFGGENDARGDRRPGGGQYRAVEA